MVVCLRKNQLDYFRAKARKTDKEVLAYLVGRVKSTTEVVVEYFAYPDYGTQTNTEVAATLDSWKAIREKAEAQGFQIIGDLHSHPNWWPVKSPADHHAHLSESHRICGVCAVMHRKTGVYFWVGESSLPCTIQYIKSE